MALPYPPTYDSVPPNVEEFSVIESLKIIKTIAVQRQMFEQMSSIFEFVERYFANTIGPEGFSVYGFRHGINDYIELFHAALLDHFGIYAPLWIFYGKYKTNI